MPQLRVVPLGILHRHEEVDPLRVDRLSERIVTEGIQVNPMVCIEASDNELVLLDGATRTESLKRIGLEYAIVQVVDADTVTLGTWHHVIRGCEPQEFLETVRAESELNLDSGSEAPSIHLRAGPTHHVTGVNSQSDNTVLATLVDSYVGRWRITRTTVPLRSMVDANHPDWASIVEFPILTLDDVMAAAVSNDLLPAGITRFLVPNRALRLNIELSLLESSDTGLAARQSELTALLAERAREGRIRQYQGPVYVLDD